MTFYQNQNYLILNESVSNPRKYQILQLLSINITETRLNNIFPGHLRAFAPSFAGGRHLDVRRRLRETLRPLQDKRKTFSVWPEGNGARWLFFSQSIRSAVLHSKAIEREWKGAGALSLPTNEVLRLLFMVFRLMSYFYMFLRLIIKLSNSSENKAFISGR